MARSRSKAVAARDDAGELSGWARRHGDRQFAAAPARGLEVLGAFRPHDGVLGNLEIAERTQLPRPTVTRLTYTLTRLGYLTHLERAEIYDHMQRRAGADWAKLKGAIEDGIEQVARYGFAMSVGDWQEDINGVGVPFVPDDGSGILAFNCGAPAFRLDRDRLQHELGPRLVAMVQSISGILTGVGVDFDGRNDASATGSSGGRGERTAMRAGTGIAARPPARARGGQNIDVPIRRRTKRQ